MKNQDQIDKKFLFKENRQLRLQLKEANEINKLHKDAIYKLSQPHTNSHVVVSILLELLAATKNSKKVNNLKEEILGLESKLMVLQKIVEQTDNDEKETYHLLVEDFNNLRQDNERLEKQLHKFYEKIGEVDYLSGLVTKHKEIINPTEQAVSFKKEQDQLLQFISTQKNQINRLTEQKKKLLKINMHMKEEVENKKQEVRNMTMVFSNPDMLMNMTMQNGENGQNPNPGNILDALENHKNENEDSREEEENGKQQNQFAGSVTMMADIASPTTNLSFQNASLNMSHTKILNVTLNNFLKMQKKVIKQEDEENIGSEDSEEELQDCPELHILFPDKVQQIKKDKQTNKVPYLNMVKIRQMMAKREKKIRKEVEADNKRINPTDKIIKLETELDITRKELASQTLKFRRIQEDFQRLLRINEELQNRNQFLICSNQRLKTNYQNIYKDYQLTKVVALRVQRAMRKEIDTEMLVSELNTTKDYEQKITTAQSMINKIFGGRAIPKRSQSTEPRERNIQLDAF